MTSSKPLVPQSAANQKRRHLSGIFLIAAVVFYLAASAVGSWRHVPHLDLMLLLFQYAVILGALVSYFRSQKSAPVPNGGGFGESSRLPKLNLIAVMGCFALLAIPLGSFVACGLVNPDESGYSFQARLYRSGRLMADPLFGATSNVRDTPAELHYANHILRPFGWFTKFPPGWPLVLSLGYLISARWLPNALFGTIQLCVIAAIGSRWVSRELGVLAAFLAALSPFYLVNSVGMMSHALCALLAATACLCLFKALSGGQLRYYMGMFACLAFAFQVRPYTAFVLTLVMTGAAIWLTRGDRKRLIQILALGALMGALAISGVLAYNHIYTGRWLVSPYAEAVGANAPPELSLNPVTVLRGLVRHGPFMALQTLLGAFPFLHVLAIYAIIRERQYRREVWILSVLYFGLVFAYLFHPEGYAVFLGERFHFEAFFALVLLGARGIYLSVDHLQVCRSGVVFALVILAVMQIGQLGSTIFVLSRKGESYRKIRAAVEKPNISGLIFLHDSPGFVAQHFNLNDADWRHASRIYLIDANPEQRAEWACRYGFSEWLVVSYAPRKHMAALESEHGECPSRMPD